MGYIEGFLPGGRLRNLVDVDVMSLWMSVSISMRCHHVIGAKRAAQAATRRGPTDFSPGSRRPARAPFQETDGGSGARVVRRLSRRRGNSLPAPKIPCIFPARAQKIPCSPAQGILPQEPRIEGLFDADLREEGLIPCRLPAQQGIFPARGPSTPPPTAAPPPPVRPRFAPPSPPRGEGYDGRIST